MHAFNYHKATSVADATAKLAASDDAVKGIKIPAAGLNTDIHASAEYRSHLITVMAQRAVDQAFSK